ncbi:MAG: fucose isomerase [Candidatus Cloacimonetes bacterium]|nr:fucose isomerase [Candidatus Cloacimonadota bacterium]MCF7813209.1 fucose isomerase [Candidatus Cloacimonadota bacterium]MCF7867408.1 fucose isomerase [Candidatus Cloacimonadota bacterium]MCF7882960.1 fucose isomerase [Candidatus Cloacimonadota bacterium]
MDFLPVASDFISDKEIQSIIELNANYFKKLACQQISIDSIQDFELLYYFVVTGGTEQQILDIHQQRLRKHPNEKVVLLAHATHNSLPAALEVLARLQQENIEGKIIYLPAVEFETTSPKSPSIQYFSQKDILSDKRIGLIGKPSDWLVASSPRIATVKEAFGAEVIEIKLDELKDLFKAIPNSEISVIKTEFISKAKSILEPSQSEIDDNIRVYLTMKKLISKYNLDAVTIRCFDLVLDLKTTGCFALSRLNDERIIAGCEGDLVSTLGMMWAYEKAGNLPWMANPAQIDMKDNSLILAHCTVPCSLVSNFKIRSHFESGIGVGIQGEFPLQEIEIFRLGGKELNKFWQVKGKIIQTGNDDNLCRTQIKVKLDDEYSVQDLLTQPLGNHLVICSTQRR